jgi:hypothetical protein
MGFENLRRREIAPPGKLENLGSGFAGEERPLHGHSREKDQKIQKGFLSDPMCYLTVMGSELWRLL